MNEFGSWDDFVSIVNRQGYAFKNLLGQDRGVLVLKAGIVLKGGAVAVDGVGVTFPATQSASSDANTFDDYEEGSWTPALAFGGGTTGITYGSRSGSYTKIGRVVVLQFTIVLTSKGSSTGAAAVTGSPFSIPLGGSAAFGPVYWTDMTSSLVNFTMFFASNSSNPGCYGLTAGATTLAQLTDADFANNSSINSTIVYHTST